MAVSTIIARNEIAYITPFPQEVDDESPTFKTSNKEHTGHF